MHPRASELIVNLALSPHPEGGHFREVFRDASQVRHPVHGDLRPAMTHIHFLLERGSFSALHRVAQTELWHHVEGDPLALTIVHERPLEPLVECLHLGRGPGCRQVVAVPPMAWQAAVPLGDFVLVGCTVAPGFSFADFELPSRAELLSRFPRHHSLIESLTREENAEGKPR